MHLRAKTRLGDRFGHVFAGPGDSKTSDSVRDILQNSIFSINRFRNLIKTWSDPLLHRVDAPNELNSRGGEGGPRTMVCAQNPVNNQGFQRFHYSLYLTHVFRY